MTNNNISFEEIEFSPISRLIRLLFNVLIIGAMAYLSYGWSFRETQEFNILIFGIRYAFVASLIFQVGPNALLALRQVTNSSVGTFIIYGLVVALNMIDFVTNAGSFYQWWIGQSYELVNTYQIHQYVVNAAYVVGWIACFAVTWFEEILLYLMGVSFHLLGLVFRDFFGGNPPRWLMVDLVNLATQASGGDLLQSRPNQQRTNTQQSNNNQQQNNRRAN